MNGYSYIDVPGNLITTLSNYELCYLYLVSRVRLAIRDGDREPVQTGLSIAVNQSKTGPPSKWFGFLCILRVPGGVIKLSAPTSSLASQCLASATIKQSGTLTTFTMLRSLLSVEKVPRELVYRNFQELSSSGKFSHAFHCVVSYPRNVINKPFRKP